MPPDTTVLLITCGHGTDAQFAAIDAVADLLSRASGVSHLAWSGPFATPGPMATRCSPAFLPLHRRRVLHAVLVSGHGSREAPAIGPPQARVTPAALRLPAGCRLFLAACYQGSQRLRDAWAAGTGTESDAVRGSCGETDSSLSTMLLLHLHEEGPDRLAYWFDRWNRANEYLRPVFPLLRRSWRESRGDPLATLARVAAVTSLAPVREFIGVVERYPDILRRMPW